MAIGVFSILFYLVVFLGLAGILLMFLLKNEKIKNTIFYLLTVLTIGVSALGFVSLPVDASISEKAILIVAALLPVAGIITSFVLKKQKLISYILVSVGIILAILKTFSFI